MPKPKASIGCKVSKDGRVTVMLIRNGKREAGVGMSAKDVGNLVVMLLASAIEAAKISGESPRVGSGASLVGMPCIHPTAIGLSTGEPPEPILISSFMLEWRSLALRCPNLASLRMHYG